MVSGTSTSAHVFFPGPRLSSLLLLSSSIEIWRHNPPSRVTTAGLTELAARLAACPAVGPGRGRSPSDAWLTGTPHTACWTARDAQGCTSIRSRDSDLLSRLASSEAGAAYTRAVDCATGSDLGAPGVSGMFAFIWSGAICRHPRHVDVAGVRSVWTPDSGGGHGLADGAYWWVFDISVALC